MRPAGCLPCCNVNIVPPVACECAFVFDNYLNPPGPGDPPNPFPNASAAQNYIDLYTLSCFAVAADPFGNTVLTNASFDGTNVLVSTSGNRIPVDRPYAVAVCSIATEASANVNVALIGYSDVGGNNVAGLVSSISVADCEGSAINPIDSGANYAIYPAPSTEIMEITLAYFGYEEATSANFNFRITSANNLVTNPVSANFTENNVTRQLGACPRLYLPPLTESTGDWYANCASANTAISTLSNNCVGFIESLTGANSFAAFASGNSVQVLVNVNAEGGTCSNMWVSVSMNMGQDFTADIGGTYANLPPLGTHEITLYDYSGAALNVSGALNPADSPWVVNNLPYTGRYIVSCNGGGGNMLAVAATYTSVPLVAHNIQSLYDISLSCAARLDCGNNCP